MTKLTIRPADRADAPAIARLAELEESSPPTGAVLVGEHDGTVVAALSLEDGHTVADIFHATRPTVDAMRRWRDDHDRMARGTGDRRRRIGRERRRIRLGAEPSGGSRSVPPSGERFASRLRRFTSAIPDRA